MNITSNYTFEQETGPICAAAAKKPPCTAP